MSEIRLTTLPTAAGASSASSARHRRANNRLAIFLIVFVGLSPIPFGSNRPSIWAISALVLATAGVIYAIALWRSGGQFRFAPRRLWVPGVLWLVLLIFLLVQAVPLGVVDGLLPFETGRGVAIKSITLSLTPGDTILMAVRYSSYALFFFLMMQISVNRDRVRKIVPVLVGIFAAHALYAMLALTQLGDTILIFEKWAYAGVATGTFVNRNSFATFLAMGAVVCAAALFREASRGRKVQRPGFGAGLMASGRGRQVVYGVVLLLILVTLISTRSRMGGFAGLAGLLWVGLVAATKMAHRGWRALALVAGATAFGSGVLVFLFGGGLLERLGQVEAAAGVRADLYEQVRQMIWARPFTGFGGGSFEVAFRLFHELPVNPDVVWDKAHSTYLGLWAELGLFFGSIPIVIMAIFLVSAVRLAISRKRNWMAPTAAAGAILVAAIHSLVDFSLEIQANTYMLLAIVALGIASEMKSSDT